MKLAIALLLLAACAAPKPKQESPLVDEGSNANAPETCCCKTLPIASDDGKPVFGMLGRIECSTRQGECTSDVQCRKTAPPPADQ